MRSLAVSLSLSTLLCLRLLAEPSTLESEASLAWAENAGWLNAGSLESGLVIKQGWLEGYVWAENIGWIAFGKGPENEANYQQLLGDIGVNRSVATGALIGYAWSENVGWIRFGANDSNNAAMDDTGIFSGYAWSENIGWIDLGDLRRAPDNEWDGLKDSLDPDDDNDRLPDTEELARGFDPKSAADGQSDPDGDGFDTGSEYVAGTDYLDPSSVFRVEGIDSGPSGSYAVKWQSVAGKRYRLLQAADVAGPYLPTGQELTASGDRSELSYALGAEKAFFRVEVLPD